MTLGTEGYLAQLIGGLMLTVAAILLLAWLLRRLPGGGGDRQAIGILAVRPVGTRERLLLVQVGGEQLLIGVTPAGMRTLHRLRAPIVMPPPEVSPTLDFAGLLKRAAARPEAR